MIPPIWCEVFYVLTTWHTRFNWWFESKDGQKDSVNKCMFLHNWYLYEI